ncbi:hypothetical protein RDV64_03495 [Acuticoccus sp. MNP-M23]|uniref:hypothetical protein n=1 Tax=Acuticoccus sp. MNP-M23 TaxID=3072793 RepID=UPI002814C2F2|nr:hypothetical protein [Acuticoccus sp. MNP-M23]WMS43476.1 hypothetical protein RDV64_03495 [Acuticoccus sp. MNP-M23]
MAGDLATLVKRAEEAEEGRDGTVVREHWDPFAGGISVATPDPSSIRKGFAVPRAVTSFALYAVLASVVWVGWDLVAGRDPWGGIALFTAGMAVVFGADKLANAKGRRTVRRIALANELGWSYTGKLVRDVGGGDTRRRSPRMTLIANEQPGLVTQLRPIDGEFWGTSDIDGAPFWLGIGTLDHDATLGAAALRKDARGGKGRLGVMLTLTGAYRLGRATGVRAVIAPDAFFAGRGNGPDLDTLSTEFSGKYHASVEPGPDGATNELALHRILTPATQTTLLDLAEHYARVGFIIDNDVLFFTATELLMGKNASQAGLDENVPAVLKDFERAKVAIKDYVE